jgi:hypothetical protein
MGVAPLPKISAEDARAVQESTPLAQANFLAVCALTLLCFPLVLNVPTQLKVLIVYTLPAPAAVLLFLAIWLDLKGTGRAPDIVHVSGMAFILGGLVFDVTATILHSPRLEREGNPVARVLLDTHHQLTIVYTYGLTGQALLGLILCTWWAAFLTHKQMWLNSALAREPRSFGEFLKFAIGGGMLSWRQILLPLDVPALYRSCYYWSWVLGPTLILSLTVARYYMGFEWFELVPRFSPFVVWIVCLALALLIFIVWLHGEYLSRSGSDGAAD